MDNTNLKRQITLGVILIIMGIVLFTKDYVADKREQVFSMMNLELSELLAYDEEISEEVQSETTTEEAIQTTPDEDVVNEDTPKKQYETYVGMLEISKINFSKGFYKKESSLNNVKYNIKILPQSNYPDEENGNVIIIGHSGNYNNSYFRNLYKLELEDTAIIEYNGKTFTYKIVNIYIENKDGTITIYRDQTKNCLTLITCTKDDDKTQTVYIFELVSTE